MQPPYDATFAGNPQPIVNEVIALMRLSAEAPARIRTQTMAMSLAEAPLRQSFDFIPVKTTA
jgi:hypothetical protein